MLANRRFVVASILTLVLLPPSQLLFSLEGEQAKEERASATSKDLDEYRERVQKAAAVLRDLMKTPDKGIPEALMERAHGIAVIPHVVKAAFGLGGRWGKGLVAGRGPGKQWGTPAFVEISGGSFGFQIGAEATDLVMVFTNEQGLKSLLESKLKLGADASVAAGPVGRGATAGTDVKLDSAIYSYSRSKGLFAGVSLEGAVLNIDDSANEKVYGKKVSGTDIVLKGSVSPNAITTPFVEALKQVSPRVLQSERKSGSTEVKTGSTVTLAGCLEAGSEPNTYVLKNVSAPAETTSRERNRRPSWSVVTCPTD